MKFRITMTTLAMACVFGTQACATELEGPNVFTFSGDTSCSFDLGSDKKDCPRIALADTATRAEVLPATHQILLINNQTYTHKTLIVDVFLPATAKDESGTEVPLILHAKISKTGNQPMTISAHGHMPEAGKFHAVTMEPWQILDGTGNKASRPLLTPQQAMNTLAHPSLAARLASDFVEVQDNRAGNKKDVPDITVKIELGGLSTSVMRARLDVPQGSDPKQFHHPFQSGDWSLTLDALSGSIPLSVVRHELFLYGLDQQPLLQSIYRKGFKKGDSLIVGSRNGAGFLSIGEHTAAFPEASESAVRFLQTSFVGLILSWQQTHPKPDPHQAAHASTVVGNEK